MPQVLKQSILSISSVTKRPSHRRTTVFFTVEDCDLPALKSAVDEVSNMVGGRLVSPHSFPREHALTSAVLALGALRAAINAVVKDGDARYAA